MELAVVTGGRMTILPDVGLGTSKDAEWLALIQAVIVAQQLDLDDFVLLGDAVDVVEKANGRISCRGTELLHLDRFQALLAPLQRPQLRYIKRSQNLAGIALAQRHPR
jgi:ribonuclease HI